jgi:glycosyltransferase involved in cell wall biosynthesis
MNPIALSIIIPVFNGVTFLNQSLERLLVWTQSATMSVEVVVVNDGSTDMTASLLETWKGKFSCYEVVSLPTNRGKGAAIREGLRTARGGAIIFTDADLPYGVNIFGELYTKCINQPGISYLYGSPEVIGLMLAKIFKVEKAAYPAAKKLGKAMQLINFIRDIDEDNKLGRVYFTQKDLSTFGLKDLKYSTTHNNPEGFKKFVHFQIAKYHQINNQGKKGYQYLPFELLTPVKTATNMYEWTAQQIQNDPFIVYRKKVKPPVSHIIYQLGRNSLSL